MSKEECLQKLKKNPSILMGVIPSSHDMNYSENTDLYKYLNVFAHAVICYSLPVDNLAKQKHNDVDVVIMRENTEGEYSGIEHEVYPGVMYNIHYYNNL